jgi:hypothetical protein
MLLLSALRLPSKLSLSLSLMLPSSPSLLKGATWGDSDSAGTSS